MMDNKSVVRVRIVGEEYTLRTEASTAHTEAVAEHVDRTIRAILSSGATVETHKAAILAALQITDELLRERSASDALTADLRQLASDIRPLLPPAKRGEDSPPGDLA
ncbi:MAG: cell division protein ZapA [Gemmatimonadaceae bacterium]|jgi:cell division protein ZapA|nr:cell division protein ZapA [Gemmatimonadaceae bacterium]MCC6429403.1 cell division protein ZapA [Gemmatimonadaceae bacterium]